MSLLGVRRGTRSGKAHTSHIQSSPPGGEVGEGVRRGGRLRVTPHPASPQGEERIMMSGLARPARGYERSRMSANLILGERSAT